MQIIQAPIPEILTNPIVRFVKNEFDQLIWDKGYNVLWDKAIRCPCKIKASDNIVSCLNCGGTGWVYINRTQTRMILQGMNFSTKYKDWSEENIGTVKISCRDIDRVAFMDRIILQDAETMYSEVLYPFIYKEKFLAYTFYEIKQLLDIYAFKQDNEKLIVLTENKDYYIENNKIFLDIKYSRIENFRLSLRYICNPQFHIIDLTRDIINSEIVNDKGQLERVNFPIAGVGRRSHYVLDVNNIYGSILFDNSINE